MSRTILVTGASKGIGRAIAERLAGDGFGVVVHYYRDRTGAEQTLASVGGGRLIQFDLTDREQCRTRLEADIAAHGAYYGVVLNAGIARDNAFPALEDAEWDSVLNTDLGGFYNVLHPVIMPMVTARRPGRIVTLSSVSGIMGNRGQVNYSAAKAGIIGATKALAIELARRNITVNCVAPGLDPDPDDRRRTARRDAQGLSRCAAWAAPRKWRRWSRFLCSDSASYVTRQVISVNGGMA